MTFSRRIPSNLDANRFTATIARLRSEQRPLIDLTASNPTNAGFDYPADLLVPLAHPRGLVYAPEAFGLRSARRAVAAEIGRAGLVIGIDDIALTASTSEAYSLIFKLLCDPGDEILMPRPSYPLFDHLTRLDAVAPVPYDLDYHGGWSLDRSTIERQASERTRAVLLVSPNNPTGHVTAADDLDWLAAFCAERGIAIISDEVFADYATSDAQPGAAGDLIRHAEVLGFTLGGLSKSIGLPQAKLAWIILSGPPALRRAARLRLELACDTYLSVSTPVQAAAADLLERGVAIRRQIQARVRANRRSLETAAHQTPSCRAMNADGGWYAVLQVPSLMPEEDLVISLADDDGVLVHPGYFFDFRTESFLVLSLLAQETAFVEGVGRILARFQEPGGLQ